MNERIKELAEQAGKDSANFYSHQYLELVPPEVLEKFAELIVREAGALLMSPEFIGRSDLDWSMVLNEHFGVEE